MNLKRILLALLLSTQAFGQQMLESDKARIGPFLSRITNAGAEVGVSGCAAYADAAGTSPVDGTGGSPTMTVTTSATSALAGNRSFVITKDAANRQGNGVSCGLTLNASDKASVITLTFSYIVGSGTFVAGSDTSDSDVTVWLYDVTNSVLIQPVVHRLYSNSSTVPARLVTSFQAPADSTNLRLIFHNGSTSASAYTLKVDGIFAAPLVRNFGSLTSDWTSCTVTGTWVSNSTYTCFRRRSGDSYEFDVSVALSGAPTATSLAITLPTGTVIDTAKLSLGASSKMMIGWANFYDDSGSVGTERLIGAVRYLSDTTVAVETLDNQAATDNWTDRVSETFPVTAASGDAVHMRFTIPVVGLASSMGLSSDTGNRPVEFAATMESTNQTISSTSATTIVWNTEKKDTHAAYDPTTGTFTVPESGSYIFITRARLGSFTASEFANISIAKNGTIIYETRTDTVSRGITTPPIPLVAGDLITVKSTSTADTSYTILAAATGESYFGGFKIQSPQTLGQGELVRAAYSTNAGQTFADGATNIVDFEDKDSGQFADTHAAVTVGAAWKFTAPFPKVYRVCVRNTFGGSGAPDEGEASVQDLYVNGVQGRRIAYNQMQASPASQVVVLSGCLSQFLNAGDYIDVRIQQNTASSQSLTSTATLNYIIIESVN